MLIDRVKFLEELEKIKKDLLTEYKEKFYNDSYVAEKNLINRIENLVKFYQL